ncbi:hypothetical protein [Streptomyces sp. NPDC047070]|uniref:hypothetical protein n=1 Tax=Streptomyces sp. NPDC047070 TaxID=3154923 RepID=UPI003451D628
MFKQQRDHSVNLHDAVDPSRDVDLHCRCGMVADGCFEDRNLVGVRVGEEAAGVLIIDSDVENPVQSPGIALPEEVPIE